MTKFNKDGSIRKKPGRKVKVKAEHGYAFPTVNLRQVAILFALIKRAMDNPPYEVDGEVVTAEEWRNLIRVFLRG